MPRETRYELVDVLLRSGDGLGLDVAGGGTWRLDLGLLAAWRGRGLLGMRVRVAGTRDGFDLLAVHTIERSS